MELGYMFQSSQGRGEPGGRTAGRRVRRGRSIVFDFKKHGHWYDEIAIVSQLGLTMAGSILLCLAAGYGLDKWLDTKPLFTIVFIILGIIGGGVTVYRQIMKVLEPEENRPSESERDHDGSG
jgi:ATP synthase protein I